MTPIGERELQLARERGERDAQLASRLDGHERAINEIRKEHSDIRAELKGIHHTMGKLADSVRDKDVAQAAVSTLTQQTLQRQVTRREFVVAMAVLAVMLLGLFVSILAVILK